MRQLLRKKPERNWTEREEVHFNDIQKMISDTPCLAHFARDRENIVTADKSRTGLGIALWQKQNDNTIQPIAFASRYLNDAQKNSSIRELNLLAAVWRLEKFRFHVYATVVFLNTNHQALEPLFKRSSVHRPYSGLLTR